MKTIHSGFTETDREKERTILQKILEIEKKMKDVELGIISDETLKFIISEIKKDITKEIEELEKLTNKHTDDISKLSSNVNDISKRVSTIDSTVDGILLSVGDLEDRSDVISKSIDKHTDEISELRSSLKSLTELVDNIKNMVESINYDDEINEIYTIIDQYIIENGKNIIEIKETIKLNEQNQKVLNDIFKKDIENLIEIINDIDGGGGGTGIDPSIIKRLEAIEIDYLKNADRIDLEREISNINTNIIKIINDIIDSMNFPNISKDDWDKLNKDFETLDDEFNKLRDEYKSHIDNQTPEGVDKLHERIIEVESRVVRNYNALDSRIIELEKTLDPNEVISTEDLVTYLKQYYTKTEADQLHTKLTEDILEIIKDLDVDVDLSNYYTIEQVDDIISIINLRLDELEENGGGGGTGDDGEYVSYEEFYEAINKTQFAITTLVNNMKEIATEQTRLATALNEALPNLNVEMPEGFVSWEWFTLWARKNSKQQLNGFWPWNKDVFNPPDHPVQFETYNNYPKSLLEFLDKIVNSGLLEPYRNTKMPYYVTKQYKGDGAHSSAWALGFGEELPFFASHPIVGFPLGSKVFTLLPDGGIESITIDTETKQKKYAFAGLYQVSTPSSLIVNLFNGIKVGDTEIIRAYNKKNGHKGINEILGFNREVDA